MDQQEPNSNMEFINDLDGNDASTGSKVTANDGNDALTGGKDTANGGNDALTGGKDTANGGNDALTGGKDTANGGNDALTGGKDTANGGNDALTGGKDTANDGNDVLTGGKDTANDGNDALTGSQCTANDGNDALTGSKCTANNGNDASMGSKGNANGHEKTTCPRDKVENGQQSGGRTRGKDQKPRRSEQDNDGTSDESKDIKIKELEEKIREQETKIVLNEENEKRMRAECQKVKDEVSSHKTARELEYEELLQKSAKITELETKLRSEYDTVKKKDTTIKELERKLNDQETANVELFEKQMPVQQLNDTLNQELKATRKIVKEQKAKITQKTNHSQQQGLRLQQQGQQIQQQDQRIQQYISYSNNLKKDLADSEEKRHELTLRLSKLAGAKLTSNNPNIADLSDTNRPTKIAERYSELYDNEWTDAYEDLSESSGTDEQTRINELLKLLKASYDECVQLSEPFRNTLESLTTVTLRVKGDQECHNRDETKQDQETMTTAVDKLVQTSLDHVGHGALKAGKHDGNHEEARSEEKMETDALENQASPQTDVQPTFSDKDSENVENQPGEAMEVGSEGQTTSNKDDNNVKTNDNLSCEKKQGQASTGSPKTEVATGDEHSLENHNTDGAVTHVDGTPSPLSQVDEGLDPVQGQSIEQNTENRGSTTSQTNPQPGYSSDVDTGQQQGPNTDESSMTEAAIEDKHSLQNHNTDGAVSPVDDTTLLVSQATGKTNIPPGFSSNVDTGEITAEVKVEVEFTAELRKNVSDMKSMCGRKLEEEMGLSKAIAQKIALERNIDAEKHERIIAYITKCAELCWFMMIQEPPVFIGFNDVKTGEPFNKDVYKAYTKTGKQLDYIVWPPLYLHKGGPMLSKGVAQGAN